MTKKTFNDLVEFVSRTCDVTVRCDRRITGGAEFPFRIRGYAVPDARGFIRWSETRAISKAAHFNYNRNGRHGIEVRFHPSVPLNVRAATLIHEFGHCQIFTKMPSKKRVALGKVREEKMAWDLGMWAVPDELLPDPKSFLRMTLVSLETYL